MYLASKNIFHLCYVTVVFIMYKNLYLFVYYSNYDNLQLAQVTP